jgi:hypothetical protein
VRLQVTYYLRRGQAGGFVDCYSKRSGQGDALVWSLGEELASPKTPSRILPVDSAMLVINGLNDIEFTCGTEEKCRGTWNRKHI